ncbi:MAG: dihydroorotase [Gammaproteobacteria bacterium]|nr:dihydroorotase [Gammaproteobacteria bacterium]
MNIAIIYGHLIDPANEVDGQHDLFINSGIVVGVGQAPEGFSADQTINAEGQIVSPGFIDLQARLREPGDSHKGTIASETSAAVKGGVTTLCMPPDSNPIIDSTVVAEQILHKANIMGSARARVLPIGALTKALAGEQLSNMNGLIQAGCVALSNANRPIRSTLVQRRAFEYAASLNIMVRLQPEDAWLAEGGCVHEGEISSRLGLSGIPECAEVIAVSRDLLLIEQTGVKAHFGPLSSVRSIELIAEARKKGLPVTADIAAHQLILTEIDVDPFNSLCHLRPPLRSKRGLDGLRSALSDGLFTAICSDHQPHEADAKLAPFAETEAGMSAIETLLPLTLKLVKEGVLSMSDAIAHLTSKPAELLGLKQGSLAVDCVADITIFDPNRDWVVSEKSLISRGKNSPFIGWEMQGAVTTTLLDGEIVYIHE